MTRALLVFASVGAFGLRKETRVQIKEFTMRKTKFSCFFTMKSKYSVFSSKQSFEEKHIFEHLVMKFIDVATSTWPASNYWTFWHIFWWNPNETLDLIDHETLKTTFAIFEIKGRLYMFFKWTNMSQQVDNMRETVGIPLSSDDPCA